ncbi:hypothetical protein [Streptosporangium longisporum]|uniref:hypothetical protein n=1 Tax=Streptosporangium longisporum TaxID=46187 RepID=UPI0031E9D4E7
MTDLGGRTTFAELAAVLARRASWFARRQLAHLPPSRRCRSHARGQACFAPVVLAWALGAVRGPGW